MNLRLAALAVLVLLTPTAALAQEAEPSQDWTIARSPENKLVAASITFDTGVGLIARCLDGVYDLMIVGLPPAPPRTSRRDLTLILGEGEDEETRDAVYTVGMTPDVVFSRIPAMTARFLAQGGKFQIVVPASGEVRRTRYIMDAPPSDAALEETLTSCGLPLYDLRDNAIEDTQTPDGPAAGVIWVRAPSPQFPAPVGGRSPLEAYALISCRTEANGRLSECQAESEQPAGFHVAREALEATRRAQVALSPEARAAGLVLEGRLILFAVNFRMQR